MYIQSATEPGDSGHPNEDFCATAQPASGHGGALVLLDGVTPPAGDDGCVHGVPWFTARLGGALLELSGSLTDVPLSECLARAITRTAASHRTTCELSHPRTPQATVVCARWSEHTVEYLVLCDTVLLIRHRDGTVRPVLDDRLEQVLAAARTAPPGGRAARVEGLRNAPGGFFTAAADPAVAHRAVTGAVPRAEVRALAALTDGASRWTEVFRLGDWTRLFGVLEEAGPHGLIARVRAAERADPAGTVHPRGKIHDDASALLALTGG
ncbi:protein phosphatase 2C domain-containing protein [Streptomyces carpaticus]|uniref:Protein phosphatase 2C domain-containing protein n=1 Tax=Streptomyces cheonanensis TaxID=312720 RepID=A0ABP5GQH2_9ACTN|nr:MULTISPECIES: protein phosphatase 2C domain-containing protein [Streptomyces]QKV70829.1 protein phosphatase 2C domain-containing protein [Streptomyces harbinensis]UWM51270.1 protein phosphatase 2C domain-containing protein [Streptomyces carpaticus]